MSGWVATMSEPRDMAPYFTGYVVWSAEGTRLAAVTWLGRLSCWLERHVWPGPRPTGDADWQRCERCGAIR
jgi:hypothetical protein